MKKLAAILTAVVLLAGVAASAWAFDDEEAARGAVAPAIHVWGVDSSRTTFWPATTRAAFMVWARSTADRSRFDVWGIDANSNRVIFRINANIADHWGQVMDKLNREIGDIAAGTSSPTDRLWNAGAGEINKPPPVDPDGPIGDEWLRSMLRAAHRTMIMEIQLMGR